MARTLSDIQKAINAELKVLKPNRKASTELEFKNSVNLQKLVAMKNKDYTSELEDPIEQIFEYDALLSKVAKVSFFQTELIDIMKSTSNILGIKHIPLLKIVRHRDYHDKCGVSNRCNSCGSLYNISALDIKIQSWIKYCSLVAQYITFIKNQFPNRTAYKKEEEAYIESLKALGEASFMTGSHHLKEFLHFYTSYGLNQSRQAMAEYLLNQKLPNINTIEIALSVVKYSEFTQVE